MNRRGRMKINNLDAGFCAGGSAEIPLPGAFMTVRGTCGTDHEELDGVLFLKQVHGACILNDPSGSEMADGMILSGSDKGAGIRTADCLPVFLKSSSHIAAFHAGWRGLSKGIAASMVAAFPGKPDFVLFGNCICGSCYTFGEDLRQELLSSPDSHLPGRIDLKRLALDQMIAAGLDEGCDVFNLTECTMCRADLFHSYRRDGTDKRNLQWIKLEG
jgi:polyphenol oxidase